MGGCSSALATAPNTKKGKGGGGVGPSEVSLHSTNNLGNPGTRSTTSSQSYPNSSSVVHSAAAPSGTGGGGGPGDRDAVNGTSQPPQPERPPPNCQLPLARLGSLTHLADGGFCSVHAAELDGVAVVIKCARQDSPEIQLTEMDLETEMEILKVVSHNNIVRLMGAGEEPFRFLVLEKLDAFTLAHVLGTEGPQDENLATTMRRRQLAKVFPPRAAMARARELASALDYLHLKAHPKVMLIHRDVKPSNIGFATDGTSSLKLMDFGLARLVARGTDATMTYNMTGETGSMRYMAPEVARHEPYNEKVDVYSLGLIMWEMLTLRRPFEGMEEAGFLKGVVNGRMRPKIPSSVQQELAVLLARCWHSVIAQRPTASECEQELARLLSEDAQRNDLSGSRHVVK